MAKRFKGKLGKLANAVRGALIGSALLAGAAQAGEGSFGWLYTLDLQPKGTWEFEQKLHLTRGQAGGKYDLWQARTELEYGVSNDFQLAGYINSSHVDANGNYPDGSTAGWLVPGSAANKHYRKTRLDGVSVEGIWRLTNPVLDPVGVGLYLEGTTGQTKDGIEGRLLLQSNFMDDKLVVAANLHTELEKYKFDPDNPADESMLDLLLGTSYRFANNWTAGVEYRYHNDYAGYGFRQRTQEAHFFGPNMHYADKNWWVTVAWRHQLGGRCWAPGDAECSNGKVWDSHGKDEYIVKVGFPF